MNPKRVPDRPTVLWHRASPRSFVVELKMGDLPILHRYFTSEEGARRCAERWSAGLKRRPSTAAATMRRALEHVKNEFQVIAAHALAPSAGADLAAALRELLDSLDQVETFVLKPYASEVGDGARLKKAIQEVRLKEWGI